MTIEIRPTPQRPDLRRAWRAGLGIKGSVRERGRSACEANVTDLSVNGCRIESWGIPLAGNQVWIRLPGLESLSGQIVWTSGSTAGVSFDQPLHSAVFGRFITPANDDGAASHTHRDAGAPQQASPLLSRREQIVSGVVDCERSPLRTRRNPSRSGLAGMISRQVKRTADHRMEPRFNEFPGDDMPPVRIDAREIEVRNLSSSGLRGRIPPPASSTVGQQVVLEVGDFAPIEGKVVWTQGEEVGISLPPDSFELNYA